MADFRLSSQEEILTGSDSLEAVDTGATAASYGRPSQATSVSSLGVHEAGQTEQQHFTPPPHPAAMAFSRRRAALVSAIITVVVVGLTAASALLLMKDDRGQTVVSKLAGISGQDVKLEDQAASNKVAQELQGEQEAVLVNGDLITRSTLKVSSGGFTTTILQSEELTADQQYTLPNASGTFCLDSNNCNTASQADLQQVQALLGQLSQQVAQIPVFDGVTSINGRRGAISIQGTSNQIAVSTINGTVRLATAQDIAPISSPTFASMLLTANFTVNGMINTTLDCSTGLNGGVLTTNASGQIICDDDDGGGGGGVSTSGGTPGALAVFTGAQAIADSIISQALGTVIISGALSVSGGLSANSLSLATAMSVANGGTGAVSFNSNGVLLGNGTGAVTSTTAPLAGQILLGNAGGVPVFVSLSGDVAVNSSGVTAIQADSVALGVDTTGNYVASLTAGNGISVGAAGEAATPTVSLGVLTADWSQTGAFDLVLNNANSELRILESSGGVFYGTLDVGDLTANRTYTLPDADGTICLTSGNCVGIGGGVTTAGGTTNQIAKFSGTQAIANSTLSDDGTNVTTTVDLIVQGGAVNIGTALQDGAVTLYGNGFAAALSTATLTGARNYTLPDGSGEICILQLGNCSSGAPNNAQYLTLALDAGLTAERTLSFNGTNFSVTDGGANGAYSVNTAQNINTAAAPSFAGLTLTGNLNLNSNTLQGTNVVVDFTNFDVAANGNILAGTFNGQTISAVSSLTGTLAVAGLTTLNGGLTVEAGDTITFNGEAFTDLTGNGLQIVSNALTLLVQANKGLEVDGNGLSLIDCSTGQILKYNGSNQWACDADAGGSGVGDDVLVNSTNADGANFVNTAATGSVASVTWALNNIASPDEISLTVGVASATEAGVVTTGTQTFAGDKTFTGLVTLNGNLTVQTGDSVTINGDTITDLTGTGLQVVGSALETTLGTSVDLTSEVTGQLPVANGGTGANNATTARSNLGAAASGANSDITSLSGLTTALSVGQGGTGANNAQSAINNLSGLTTNGDLLYHNGVNTTRLARGSDGQCLLSSTTTINWGSCAGTGTTFFTIQGTSGTPQSVNGGDTVTIAAGNNITTTAGATDTITVATVNNPVFSTSVTTPLLQSTGALTLDSGSDILLIDASDTTIRRTAAGDFVFDLADSANTTFVIDNSGAGAANLRVSGLTNCDSVDTDASGNLVCGSDAGGSGLGDNVLVNGSNASDANFVNTATTASVAGLTWNLNTVANPDEITLSVSVASATDAGIVTATSQTFGGDKTFNGVVTLNGNLVVQTGDSITVNGQAITDFVGTGLQVVGSTLETTLGTSIDLTSEVTGQLPDANVSDTITVGAGGSVNDAALSSNVTKLGATITKDELTNSGLLGFTWSDSEVADNLTVDWTGLQNYPTGCNSGEAVTAVGDSLTCAVFATADTDTTYSAGNDLDLSGTTFNIESQLDFVSIINRTSANLTLQTSTTGDIVLSSAGNIRLSGFNCTSYTNGGVLTTDASGNIVCANDEGAAGGTVTGSGTTGRLSVFTGTNTIGDGWLNQNGSTLEVDTTRNLSLLGGNLSVTGGGTFTSTLSASNFSGSSSGTNTGDVSLSGQNYLSLSGQVITANQIDLTGHVTGILPAANGGTGNGFTQFSGASGSTKTYTLPNASTTILTTNSAVTIGQGGTGGTTQQDAINNLSGLTTEGDLLYHNGVNSTRLARGSNGQCLLSSGSTISWGSCSGSGTTFFTIQGSTGTPQSVNGGDTVTIAAGDNIITNAGATDTITVSTVDNPVFDTSVTTPILQSVGSLTLDAGDDILLIDGSDTTIRHVASGDFVFDLVDASNTTFVVDNSGAGAANLRVTGLANCDSIDTDASGNLVCGTDAGGSGVGDSIQVNGSNASDGNFVDTTGSGSVAGITWNLNTGPNPDQISLAVSNASATLAGVVTTGTQTFAGDKTFNGLVTLSGDLVVDTGGSITINGATITDFVGTGLQVVGSTLETTLGTSVDLTSEVTGQLPDANVSDTITVGASGSVNDAALSSNVTKLGATITKDELTNSGLLGFTWSDSEVADNLTIDWTGLQNYPTGCNTGEAVTAVGDTLTCAVFATVDTDTTYSAGNDLDLSGTTFNIESQLDFVSTINRTGANLTLQTTTSGDIILSSAGNIRLNGFNCTGYTNGGVLTTDASGNIICANDEGAAGGTITGSGTANKLAVFTGANTIGDSWLTQNVSTLEVDNGYNLELVGGDLTVDGDGSFTGTISASNFSGNSSGTNTGDVSLSGQNYLSLSGQVITANQINLGTHVTGQLPVANGGTGANNATTARSNLGAAASGANSDITSLSGLTTALSVGQGGTGATTFTTNGILFGNGTSAIQVTAVAANSVLVTDGSNVPSLSQTLPAVVQANITSVGVLTSGTWNGTVITDTYISDTLTVGSASTVEWTALNNYPAACSAGQAITQLGDTITCAAFASSSGSGNYIQNQNASQQTSANFWISGTGRADTALQAPIFDTATATTLTIGGTATAISVADDTTLAAGKYLRITGDNTAGRPASPGEGTLFYDTTTKQLLVYANGKWKADSTDAILVAASNSSQRDKDAADYVADGDTGAANDGDQVEINAALTAGAGKKVVLLPGAYYADATILIPNNTVFMGVSKNNVSITLDIGSSSDNLIENSDTVSGQGITIQDIKLYNFGTGGTQYGLYLDSLISSKLNNLGFSGWDYGDSIMLVDSSFLDELVHTQAMGVHLDNSTIENLASNNTGDITLESTSMIYKFLNNTIMGGNISIDDSTILTMTGNLIIGDITVDSSDLSNFSSNFLGGSLTIIDSNATTIAGNSIESTISLDASNSQAITGNTILGLTISNGSDVSILSGNSIQIELSVNDSAGIQITGNTIYGNQTAVIDLSNADNVSLTGNKLTTLSSTYSISIDSNSNNVYLSDNDLGGLPIDDQSSTTIYGGQVDVAGNFMIQPAGTIELMADTNVTGNLSVSGTSQFDGLATFDGNLRISDASSNYVTIDVEPLAGNYTVSIPTITANDTFCLESLANCAAAPSNFIQNQNASQQTSANFWISGTGRADTSLLAPTFDTATATTLTIGGTATAISLADDTTLAAGKFLRITGDNTAGRPATPSAGTLFYDITTNQLLTYNGTKWVSDRSTSTKIVAASNASQALKDGADYVASGTNDHTTINSALTAAAGGKVYLTEGTFTLGGSVSIPNNTTLSGAGNGTLMTIPNAFNSDMDAITNSDTSTGTGIAIKDLHLDGNKSNQSSGYMRAIYLNGMGGGTGASARTGAVVNQATIHGWTSNGVSLNGSSHNTIANTMVWDSSIGFYAYNGFQNKVTNNSFTGNGSGIYLNLVHDSIASDNLIQDNSGSGISFVNSSTDNSIIGNAVSDNGNGGISTNSGSDNTTISGNVIQGNTANGISLGDSNNTVTGNTLKSNTNYGLSGSISSRNTITGNNAQSNGNSGFFLSGGYNTITGNESYSNSGYGFHVSSDNNTLNGNVSQSNTYGIFIGGSSNNATSNVLSSNTTFGILIVGDTNVIYGNRISDSGGSTNNNAIYVSGTDNNTITGNNITDSAASGTNYAININGASADTNYLADNTLGGGSIYDSGTGTIYGGQLNSSGNYIVDPSGTIELQSNSNVTGTLGVSGLTTLSGGLTVTSAGNVAFQRNATDYTATGTQDNVNFGTGVMFRITSASPVTINGIAGGTDGRLMTLVNASANMVTIGNNASATPANNVVTGTGSNAALLAGASVNLAYDSSSNVWRIIGSGSGVGGGTYVDLQGSTPGTPQTGNLNISGTSIFGTAVKTPSLDLASAGSLSLGTSTATSILMGSNATTTISVGQSTTTNTINIGNGNLTSGTQTINIGTGPTSSGVSTVAVGSTNSSSSTTVNAGTGGILLATNGGTSGSAGTVVRSTTNNSSAAFQVQNASSSAIFSINTSTPNLIIDPSFETNELSGWSARGSATFTNSGSTVNFGNYSLAVTTQSAANNGVQYSVGLQPSTTYTFSFFARRDASSANSFNIGRRDTTADTDCLTNQTINTTWTQFSCTFTTGSTIGNNPNVYIKQTDTSTDNIFIDGATLVAGSTARTYSAAMEGDTLHVENSTGNVTLNLGNTPELQPWRNSPNTLPGNRNRYAAASYNGYLYIMGGGTASDGGTPQNTVYYTKVNADGSIGSWNTTSTLNTAVSGGDAAVVNGYVYIVGGSTAGGGSGYSTGQTLVQYARINTDGTLGTWTTTTGIPQARYELSVTSANGYIYAIGGINTSNVFQSTIYYAKVNGDGTISSWNTNGTALSANRAKFQAFTAAGKIYMLGGENANSNQTNVGELFTINENGSLTNRLVSPTNFNNLPVTVGDVGAFGLNGYVYTVGGWIGSVTNAVYYSSTNGDGTPVGWRTSSTPLPIGRENMTVLTANGYVYVIGGEASSIVNSVYYTSTARTQIGGSLDLIGLSGGNLSDGSSGGSLTAGNTIVAGTLQVQEAAIFNNNMTVNGTLAVNANATFRNDTDSATAFQIQNAAGTTALTVDTTTLNVVIGNGGNTVTMSANGITLAGTARNSKKILLSAEYLSSVLDPGTASDNTGSMTSGYDTANRMNYYKWTTASGTTQSYDVVVQVPLPNDFSAWASNTPLTISTYSSTTSANTIQVQLLDSGNSAPTGYNFTDITPTLTTTWQSKTPATTITGTYTPGDYITLRIRMYSPTGGDIRIGNVILNYLSNK